MASDPSDELFDELLVEAAEEDCGLHVHSVTVTYTCDPTERRHSRRRIAGMLRLLAEYTDGFCAARDARDADLGKPTGIVFRFSSTDKRKVFRARVVRYLNANVVACLALVDG